MSYPVLDIQDLCVSFGKDPIHAVKKINFSVEKGEIVAIVGESGSGKTVTSLSILQLLPGNASVKTSGAIYFSEDGKERVNLLGSKQSVIEKIRGNKISMIFQEPMTSLNPLLTCGDQIIEVLKTHYNISTKDASNKTISLFEKVKLPDPINVLKKYPHQLSGGQKQRVMIAMAMSCNPSLLIADEPTTALDVTVQKTIIGLIKELQKEFEMGVIYITHDLNLVASIAERIIVMLRGEIVEQGTVASIFTSPQHPYTKALLACRPTENSKGKRLKTISDILSEQQEDVPTNTLPETGHRKFVAVKNLTVKFPLKRNIIGKVTQSISALDDISFEINKGETLGIVGESGSGKTTLGRALIRLIKPTSGEVIIDGKNIAPLSDNELRKLRSDIQIIFQDPFGSLNPRMTIGNAIEEPLYVHNIIGDKAGRKDRVIELLGKVDLKPEHFNRYPHEFSGGQRQRICIARAIAMNPEFIICDESVSALDVSVQAQILNLLNDLKASLGFTCVFISHDLNVVRYISDRIMVMRRGKIVESGLADEIYFSPKNDYTKELISAIPKGFVRN